MTVNYTIGHNLIIADDGENDYLIPLEEDFDVCDPKMTNCPRKAFRQFSGYGSYFMNLLPSLSANAGEYPRIMPLSDVIEEIRALSDDDYEKVFLPKLREEISKPYTDSMKAWGFVDKTPGEVEKIMEEMSSDVFYFALHKDRVHWFKYWSEKCMELYGEDAKIQVD